MRSIVAAMLLLAVSASAAPVRFDQGFSIPALLERIRLVPAVADPASSPDVRPNGRITRWFAGWKTVTIQPGQTQSEVFDISATPMIEECTVDHRGGMTCRETFGNPDRRRVQLVFENRPQVSGPEVFDVMLEWYQLTISKQQVQDKSYDWKLKRGKKIDQLILTPSTK